MGVSIEYRLMGFEGVTLHGNKGVEIENPIIKSIFISDDLTSMIVRLRENVSYYENYNYVELFLNHVNYNMASNDLIVKNKPLRVIEQIHEEYKSEFRDEIRVTDSIAGIYTTDGEMLLKSLGDNFEESIERKKIEDRILGILKNDNRIIQFMSLYELMIEVVSIGKGRCEQKNVCEFIRFELEANEKVGFVEKTHNGKQYEVDMFTNLRNEIAHCQVNNDMWKYRGLGANIGSDFISEMIRIIIEALEKRLIG